MSADPLTHKAACKLLAAAAGRLTAGHITRGEWFAAVDAILARRGL